MIDSSAPPDASKEEYFVRFKVSRPLLLFSIRLSCTRIELGSAPL